MFKFLYKNWPVHNLIAHPLSELAYWMVRPFGKATAKSAGDWIHDGTIPSREISEREAVNAEFEQALDGVLPARHRLPSEPRESNRILLHPGVRFYELTYTRAGQLHCDALILLQEASDFIASQNHDATWLEDFQPKRGSEALILAIEAHLAALAQSLAEAAIGHSSVEEKRAKAFAERAEL